MNWPPMWAYVKIGERGHGFGFWVPLFLIGLILFALFLAFLPLIVFVILILWPVGWGKWMFEMIKTGYTMMCAVKGTKVDIQGPKENVYIKVV